MNPKRHLTVATMLAVVPFAMAAPAHAQFYKDRTINWIVGAGGGSDYSLYARILAEHWKKHIPGQPNIIVEHNPKSGGRHAADYVSNTAPKDGHVICMTQQNVPIFQILDPQGTTSEVVEWQWIGNVANQPGVVAVWHTTGVTSIDDLGNTEVIMGATGKTSVTYVIPTLLKNLLGAKLEIVEGYRGSRPILEAIQSGEVTGFALSWTSLEIRGRSWTDEGKIKVLAQDGLTKEPDLANVPLLWELARNDTQKAIFRLMGAASKFGRAVWAPPGVPADRVAALREGFDKTMRDPAFLADMRKHGLPVDATDAAGMKKLVEELTATDRTVVSAARRALGL